ncbi:PACE efflux transporter [Gemmobacter caeruleus]|uniref:PACE efflux transporter n=1 Tax=Gemmobacter caeruleus TaxID=2595004 RepID=UPI0011F0064B|nr:PACE efflux transporter [Gemmobacter caeruleus]
MRTFRDRLRHALAFEIIGLLIITPLAALVLHHPAGQVWLVTIGSALLAMAWTGLYHWLFDLALARLTGSTQKGWPARIVQAVLFETGLLILLAPFIAWVLGVGLWQAVLLDLGFALFYMVYALGFNWAWDRLFPAPPLPAAGR